MSDAELKARRAQVAELTRELEEANRGLIALYTELERAKEAEARLAAIVHASDDAMFSMTLDGLVDSWNPGAARLLGYRAEDVLGHPVEMLVPERAREQLDAARARLLAGERSHAHDTWRRRQDGTLVEVSATLSAMRGPEGELIGFSAVLRDLTRRSKAEADLAAARAGQEVMADRERIARDLHDLVIQRIFGAGLALHGAINLAPGPDVERRLEAVIHELDATVSEIRSTIFALSQPPGEGTGVRARLQQAVSAATSTLGFTPSLTFNGAVEAAVPYALQDSLLAVLREALANVARHAQASAVEVSLSTGDELVLRVVDDGTGLRPVGRRSGLRNLQQRAESRGGSCSVANGRRGGTELDWRVPLRR
ncbi:MAG: PAS domain S-box protein [Candidatus Dormibacteraeota bacterium]|nr:PAS domain S-box protein [Candidatus Dormibacteraeota bacterium]MBO0704774.1 PAS domain S-box protein [Candidatus Dormibacteraeota bacterium]MBO0760971.1 PAS domain S-box protein [Candidatus Dormibacteraeota bacterium]